MQELKRTGLDIESGLTEPGAFSQTDTAPEPPSTLRVSADVIARLDKAHPAVVARVFEGEPAWVCAAVLGARRWQWSSATLEMLRPQLASATIRSMTSSKKLLPNVLDALINALAQQVERGSGDFPF